jgi:class 3 adenylate cyclase
MISSDTTFKEVIFHSSGDYCVCFADIAGSTLTVSRINDGKERAKYYAIFLNCISAVVRQFGAKVIKDIGDDLFWYFPQTQNHVRYDVFERVIDCCMALMKAHTIINNLLLREGLHCVDYRIGADYGRLEVALTKTSVSDDFFVPTMHMCVKIIQELHLMV